jgi:hypothetical protein
MKKLSITLILSFAIVLAITMISCQKSSDNPVAVQITVLNPGFEDSLNNWKIESDYVGIYGFQSSADAVRTGKKGLNFYAAKPADYPGAPQETPWNGKISQTITGLKDGNYTFKVYADAVGTGMYLWANGGGADVKAVIKSNINELNTLDFVVTGGIAKFGFICINANSNGQLLSPYFHADDVELWTKSL